jgi:hypothetical protein
MSEAAPTLTVVIPLSVKPRGGRKAVVTSGVLALERRQDITLIKAVARAFRWRRMLETGRFATINELAAAEKINESYISRVLRLTLLAPDMVEAILDGRQPEGVTLLELLEGVAAEWRPPQPAAVATITNPASDCSRRIRLDFLSDWPKAHGP